MTDTWYRDVVFSNTEDGTPIRTHGDAEPVKCGPKPPSGPGCIRIESLSHKELTELLKDVVLELAEKNQTKE